MLPFCQWERGVKKTLFLGCCRQWTTTSWSIFQRTCIHTIPTYNLHSTETNLNILGNRPEALIMFTQSHKFYPFIKGQVFVLSKFFHDTKRCVKISHVALVFKWLCACLASNINYCAGLYKKNMATTKEMVNYIATTIQGDKEKAITELVLGV